MKESTSSSHSMSKSSIESHLYHPSVLQTATYPVVTMSPSSTVSPHIGQGINVTECNFIFFPRFLPHLIRFQMNEREFWMLRLVNFAYKLSYFLTGISSFGLSMNEMNCNMFTNTVSSDSNNAKMYPALQPTQNAVPTDVTKGKL